MSVARDILREIEQSLKLGESCAIVSTVDGEGVVERQLVGGDSMQLVAELEWKEEAGQSRIKQKIEWRRRILVFGAGHVGHSVAILGAMVGFDIVVIDDREEFLSKERFPDLGIKVLSSEFGRDIDSIRTFSGDAVVIVTRGHQYDEMCLKGLIRKRISYIGMIGSKRRVFSIFKKLKEEGYTDVELSRVRAPIGLRIGARTPREIAISILAEIIENNNRSVRG